MFIHNKTFSRPFLPFFLISFFRPPAYQNDKQIMYIVCYIFMYDVFSICKVHMNRHCYCFSSRMLCIDVIVLWLENTVIVVVVFVREKNFKFSFKCFNVTFSTICFASLLCVCCLFLSCFIVCKWKFIVFLFPRFTFFEILLFIRFFL